MAGDKDKKKKRSSKKGSKDRAKSRAKPLDVLEAFDRAATTLNDVTAKLMRAAERHAPGDVNHDGAPDDRVRGTRRPRAAATRRSCTTRRPTRARCSRRSVAATAPTTSSGARGAARPSARAALAVAGAAPPASPRRAAAPRGARRAAAAAGRGVRRRGALFTRPRDAGAPPAEGADAAAARGHEVVELEKATGAAPCPAAPRGEAAPGDRRGKAPLGAPPRRGLRLRVRPAGRGRRDADVARSCATRTRPERGARRPAARAGRGRRRPPALEASNAEADAVAEKAPASKVGRAAPRSSATRSRRSPPRLPRLPDADPDGAAARAPGAPRRAGERGGVARGPTQGRDVRAAVARGRRRGPREGEGPTEDYAGEGPLVDLAATCRHRRRARARAAGDERRRLRALEREAELRARLAAARAEAGDPRGAPAPARRRRGRGRRRRRLGPPPPARSNPATLSPAAGACLERRDERVAQPLGRLAPAGQTRRGHRLSIIILAVETRRGGFLDAPRDVTTCTFFFRRRLRFCASLLHCRWQL